MYFEAKEWKAGKCYESSKTYRLNRNSEVTIFWWFDSSQAIGWTICIGWSSRATRITWGDVRVGRRRR